MPADARATTSVWNRPQPPQREQLTREQIVAAALELLDADGVEALSMRKLGTRLGAGAASLYRHVANRDELVQLVVDSVFGELTPAPSAPGGAPWREAVSRTAAELRETVLRHPWIGPELGQVGLLHVGPNAVRMTADLLARFETAGFPEDEREPAAGTLMSYVIGTATTEAAYLSLIARSGVPEDEWVARHSPGADAPGDPREAREARFRYGLTCVLDGLAARLSPPAG
jgi:AcrR family transcriptional regulator